MEETFFRVSDYTLRVEVENKHPTDSGIRRGDSVSRTFNFRARQLTTVERSWIYEPRGGDAGGTSAISTHSRTESFDDLPGTSEIALMHEKLCSMDGHPPPLEEVMAKNLGKPQGGLRTPNRGK